MALPALADCAPGFDAVEFNVVVAVADAEKVSSGGIILPPDASEARQAASMRGRVVSVSPLAFNYDTWPEGSRKPQPGDEIVFAKYAGVLIEGEDKREYRIIKDRDVAAVYRVAA